MSSPRALTDGTHACMAGAPRIACTWNLVQQVTMVKMDICWAFLMFCGLAECLVWKIQRPCLLGFFLFLFFFLCAPLP